MKIEKRWIISFVLISIAAISGLFWESTPAATESAIFNSADTIVTADVALQLSQPMWLGCSLPHA